MEDGESGGAVETYPHFATQAIHAGQDPDQWKSRAVVPLISLSTTFKQDTPGKPFPYEYSRGGNPTRTVFETCIASLEAAKYAISTSSGLAAQSTIVQILSSGDHIVSMGDVYGGTHRQFRLVVSKFGIETTYVDATDLSQVEAAIRDNTKMVWVESCTNPLLRMVDVQALVDVVKSKNKDIMVVVDNTFMTPYFQRPLEMGADIILHSVTKYLNGHSDVLMGVLCLNDEELEKKLRFVQFAVGMVPSPFDCYLANRGLKTLHLRMREHQRNAMAVAQLLANSPHVTDTIYPGLWGLSNKAKF
jgi:cystathionine gamma-lyase